MYDLLSDAAYTFNFVGTRTSHYTKNSTDIILKHEGVPSIRADQILAGGLGQASLSTKLNQYDIDIVLLHAGTNDIIQADASSINHNSHATTKTEIEDIITTLQAKNPQVTIFVAKVIPIYQNPDWSLGLNKLLTESWANAVSTETSKVIIVDQHTGMTANDYADGDPGKIGVHPNQNGENKMAQKWFDALKKLELFINQLRIDPAFTLSAPSSGYIGKDITITANSHSNAPITFTSSSTGVCSIQHATLHPITVGRCEILVEQKATAKYHASHQTLSINILAKKIQKITLAVAKQKVEINKTFSPEIS